MVIITRVQNHSTLWRHSTHPSLALSSQLAEVLRGRGGEDGGRYRPLLVCQDGGLVSETAAAVLVLARCDPRILRGGYLAYRRFVEQHLVLEDRWRLDTVPSIAAISCY